MNLAPNRLLRLVTASLQFQGLARISPSIKYQMSTMKKSWILPQGFSCSGSQANNKRQKFLERNCSSVVDTEIRVNKNPFFIKLAALHQKKHNILVQTNLTSPNYRKNAILLVQRSPFYHHTLTNKSL